MLLFHERIEGNAVWGMWQIEETVDALLQLLHNDPDIEAQVNQFGSEKRKLEFLATRVMLAELLGENKKISYHISGDPYFDDRSYYISIAHTGCYVTVLLHPERPVGIDVERIGDKVGRIRHRFLSQNEMDAIFEANEKTHLTLLWAAKETLYKVIKKEVVDFITDLHIEPFQPYLSGEILAHETCTEQQRHYRLHYRVYPEYVCVWTIQD
ncbi:MAG: 4'-phosphopantetheinyl transferase superfamily protein [Prevotellaceae bacterium]|jgi:phosphopantetheinyl transferase|nr:4'-phosphopantetheinyl transferase superfamily protein [Prevotellaceae bacterium]